MTGNADGPAEDPEKQHRADMAEMSASQTTDSRRLDALFVGGLAWTAGAKWLTQLFTWGALLIVARLLSPADYGLGEIAGYMTSVSNVIAEFGIGTAVLHMPELSRRALAQLHSFSVIVCAAAFGLACVAAPWVAMFFRTDHVLLFVVNNLALFITGFQSVPMGLLQRDMDYRRLSLSEAAFVMVQSAVTVVGALLGWGYWALIFGVLSGKITAAVMVYRWKHVGFAWPRWADIQAPVTMGRQAAVGRVAWALYSQADGIIIGRVLGQSVLGIYRMALNLAGAPAEKISTLLMRTAAPLFARVKDVPELTRRYYLTLVEILMLSVAPLMTGLILTAGLSVNTVFGAKWTAASIPLRWLAAFMTVRTIGILTEQVLISRFRTRFTMRMSILNFVVMPIAFAAGAGWMGTQGVAAAWLILSPITVAPLVIVLLREIHLPVGRFAGALFPAIVASAGLSAAVMAVRAMWLPPDWGAARSLSVLVVAGGLAYAAVLLVFFRERILRYFRFLADLRTKRSENAVEAV